MFDEAFRGARWHRLVPPGDRFGVSCDAEGPSIGPVRLFERTDAGLKPRSTNELDFVLSLALGRVTDFAAKMSGLDAVARALDAGDLARAMIATQLTHLPTLPDDGAFRRALRADTLAKAGFDPGQPRDDHGQWTADDVVEAGPSAGSPRHFGQAPARYFLIPIAANEPAADEDECQRAYERDAEICRRVSKSSDRAKCWAVAGDRLGDCRGGRSPRPFNWKDIDSAPSPARPESMDPPAHPGFNGPSSWWPLLLLPLLGGVPA